MKKTILTLTVFVILVAAGSVLAAGKVADVLTLKSKQGDVTFTHKAHSDIVGAGKCNKCHHTSKADGSDVKKCGDCHLEKESEKDGKKVMSIKDAAHKQCQGCHAEMKAKHPKAPGKKCTECHVKKK